MSKSKLMGWIRHRLEFKEWLHNLENNNLFYKPRVRMILDRGTLYIKRK